MRLIDKEAYEDRMREVYCKPCEAEGKDHYGVMCKTCWVDDSICSVDSMTEVDAEPVRRGKWNCVRGHDIPTICSVCGEDWDCFTFGQDVEHSGDLPNFCPHCGAKMEGEGEEI